MKTYKYYELSREVQSKALQSLSSTYEDELTENCISSLEDDDYFNQLMYEYGFQAEKIKFGNVGAGADFSCNFDIEDLSKCLKSNKISHLKDQIKSLLKSGIKSVWVFGVGTERGGRIMKNPEFRLFFEDSETIVNYNERGNGTDAKYCEALMAIFNEFIAECRGYIDSQYEYFHSLENVEETYVPMVGCCLKFDKDGNHIVD